MFSSPERCTGRNEKRVMSLSASSGDSFSGTTFNIRAMSRAVTAYGMTQSCLDDDIARPTMNLIRKLFRINISVKLALVMQPTLSCLDCNKQLQANQHIHLSARPVKTRRKFIWIFDSVRRQSTHCTLSLSVQLLEIMQRFNKTGTYKLLSIILIEIS